MTPLAVHAVLPRSHANGPGVRAVVWTQGCRLACPGCFNPATHDFVPSTADRDPAALAYELADPSVDGLTVSGGEPLDQWTATIELLESWRQIHSGTTLLLTGYTLAQLRASRGGEVEELTRRLDVLIAGPYREAERLAEGLRGSANKRTYLFSDRHTSQEIDAIPPAEVIIDPAGRVTYSGVDPISAT